MKRIIITTSLIIGLSLTLTLNTKTEIKSDNNLSRLYSGTLVDMVSPNIAPTYSLNDIYVQK